MNDLLRKYMQLSLDSAVKTMFLAYLIVFALLGANIANADDQLYNIGFTQIALMSNSDARQFKSVDIKYADAQALIDKLIASYEMGNIDRFVSVFDRYVRTEDSMSRATVRAQYKDLFSNTESRLFMLHGIDWKKTNNKLTGHGDFQVNVKFKSGKYMKAIKGKFTMDVEKKGSETVITKFIYH